jgi:hypothetical protein
MVRIVGAGTGEEIVMRPTEKAMSAFGLGLDIGLLRWHAWQDDYSRLRDSMLQHLADLEIELPLPETVDQYLQQDDDIAVAIRHHLEQERVRLGGDTYALTLWIFGRISLELVLSAAWKSDNYEPLLWILTGILTDLSIEGEFDDLKRTLDVEVDWLTKLSDAQDGELRQEDAMRASSRLVGRVLRLWGLAEEHGLEVGFGTLPYHSVFISYSTDDEEFCDRLYEGLRGAGVRVWYAPHDIKPGRKIVRQLQHAIGDLDKLLIVLSEASMQSSWVETELYNARQREQAEGVQMLFPIGLVPFEQIRNWSAFDADTGKDLARELREYYIPDFSNWRDDDDFGRELTRLVEALVVEEAAADG